MNKMLYKRIFSLFLILILSLGCIGCHRQVSPQNQQNEFDTFLEELFIQKVQSDSLSLNYSLARPERYGITMAEATFGEFSAKSMNREQTLLENQLSRLLSYDYPSLSEDQQLTYDILKNYLQNDLALGDYNYYYECLGPTTGIQAQLPILLAEYGFYDKDDIDEYLRLLPRVYDYFGEIIRFQREKSKAGLFMSDAVAKQVIAQGEAFIADAENNFLITCFNDRVSGYSNLSQEEISSYQAANTEIVLSSVIPAYQMLVDALRELLGTGTNNAGLFYYPEGKDYYACLARRKTGSGKSMEEMTTLLEAAMAKGVRDITSLTLSDPDILGKYIAFRSYPITAPEEILLDLKADSQEDFPAAPEVNCRIKYVPDSLADYLSPAMYLVPPMDNYRNNDIYINGSDEETLSLIYPTVAHEGYPGHMYQCVYFRSLNPAPIRNVMNFTGYDEGWATYVEMYSYKYAGIDPNLARFLQANNAVILCLYARTDIGIHYEGWNKKTAMAYIMNYIADAKIAGAIYDTLLEEPAVYLPYAVGYLELEELRGKAEHTLGKKFVAKDFHQFLLEIGPAPFEIIEDRMVSWMKSR